MIGTEFSCALFNWLNRLLRDKSLDSISIGKYNFISRKGTILFDKKSYHLKSCSLSESQYIKVIRFNLPIDDQNVVLLLEWLVK